MAFIMCWRQRLTYISCSQGLCMSAGRAGQLNVGRHCWDSQSRKIREVSILLSWGTTFLSEQQTPLSVTHRNRLILPSGQILTAFLCNLFSVFYTTCQLSISQLDLCVLDHTSDPVCFFSQKISQFCCPNPHSRCLCFLASQQHV